MCIVCSIENRTPGIYDCIDLASVSNSDTISQTLGGDTVPGSTATTETIAVGGEERGVINSADEQDWFRITLTAGETYTFKLEGVGDGALREAHLRLLDESGALIAENEDRPTNRNGLLASEITFTASTSGTYNLSAGGFGSSIGFYVLTATAAQTPNMIPAMSPADVVGSIAPTDETPGGDTVPGSPATTDTIAVGGEERGVINSADEQDWFRITLTAGETYTFKLEGVGDGALREAHLRLFDESGAIIAENEDRPTNRNGLLASEITFTASTSGTYNLSAGGFGGSVGFYVLTATAAPSPNIPAISAADVVGSIAPADETPGGDTVPGSPATTETIAVGGEERGVINSADEQDWFRITLTAGETYTFKLEGVGDGALREAHLRLFDESGAIIAENEDSPTNRNGLLTSEITFTASTSGTYNLSAGGVGSSVGFYVLTATAAPSPNIPAISAADVVGSIAGSIDPTYPGPGAADDEGGISQTPGADTVAGSTATTETIAVGSHERGFVNSAGDQDWFRITLTAGETYTFRLDGFAEGALRNPYLRLFNSSGGLVTENDDRPSNQTGFLASQITHTASTSGTFYVSAGGFGTSTGQYLLTANAGTTPYFPTVSTADVADYIQYTYWEARGFAAREWGATNVTFNVTGLEPERADLARLAFATWAEVCGLTFTETAGAADITLDDTDESGAYASTSTSSGTIISASVNIGTTWFGGLDDIDSYTFQTYIHEIGHTLGLGHGGPYNGSATYGVDNLYANDTWAMTIMSYMDQADANFGSYRYIMTPMMADIFAVQQMYGAATTRTGNTTYGHNANTGATGTGVLYDFDNFTTAPSFTIYDSGGNDTLDASGYADQQTIDLRGGNFSNIGGLMQNIGISTTTVIENAVGGAGNDTLFGNSANNTLNGGGGGDEMQGFAGNDTYIVENALDQVFESAGGGTDTVKSWISWTLGNNIERLQLLGIGNNATGNGLANQIYGNAGNNLINGGGAADRMEGFAGNDTYIVDNAGDQTIEAGGGGTDTVKSWISWALSGNIERLQLLGIGNNATGNGLNNQIYGNAGNNVINGAAGGDRMEGFAGNDTYIVDNAGDQTIEAGGGGTDTVRSWISWALAGNIERLQLLGIGNNATGNGLANQIYGNAGNNVINGGGAADRMEGFAGNDTYIVDNAGDQVIEAAGGGTDTVKTWISHTLGANIERLQLLGVGNNGAGNSLNNEIFGNAGNNRINGLAGNDTLTGGAGFDTFIFNTALNPATNVDTITDFSVANDTIQLENAIFTAIGPLGTLAAAAFHIGAAATTAAHRIVYNSATGALIYDSNGSAAGGATQFAILDTGLALTNADFLIS